MQTENDFAVVAHNLIMEGRLKMKYEEINAILAKHALWLNGEEGGERACLKNADLSGVTLENANFHLASLKNVDFRNARLYKADFSRAELSGVNFGNAYLRNADFSKSTLLDTVLSEADMKEAKLHSAIIEKTELVHTDLSCADTTDANFLDSNLNDAILQFAAMANANLSFCSMERINMNRTDAGPVYIRGCDMGCAKLKGALLAQAYISETNMHLCDMQHAVLIWAVLLADNLHDVNLRNADIRFAEFSRSDLYNANLEGAKMADTDFTGSNTTGVNAGNTDLTVAVTQDEQNNCTSVTCAHCGAKVSKSQSVHFRDMVLCRECAKELLVACVNCGEIIPRDEAIYCGDDILCPECADDLTTTCDRCGEICYIDDTVECEGDIICQNCADDYTVICDCCGDRIYEEHNYGSDSVCLCRDCREDHYDICADCGALLHEDDICYTDYSGEALCLECLANRQESMIHDYSYKPHPIFYGNGPCFLGVELEIDEAGKDCENACLILNAANRCGENLYIKTDGSLDDGMELVTHPMSLDYHMREMPWESVLEEARSLDYLSHQTTTCGLHVHISRMAFGNSISEQEPAIARLVYFIEKFWPEMLRFSRRTERQLERWASRYGAKINPKEQMEHVKKSGRDRYKAVNLTNRNTVEIRIFRGTLKLNTLLATLQMVKHIRDLSVSMSDSELEEMGWCDFVEGIEEPELIRYLKERKLYVNDPVQIEEEV